MKGKANSIHVWSLHNFPKPATWWEENCWVACWEVIAILDFFITFGKSQNYLLITSTEIVSERHQHQQTMLSLLVHSESKMWHSRYLCILGFTVKLQLFNYLKTMKSSAGFPSFYTTFLVGILEIIWTELQKNCFFWRLKACS